MRVRVEDLDEYPEEITVEVTKQDIRNGLRRKSTHCPLARALSRVFPNVPNIVTGSGLGRVSVSPTTAYIDYSRAYDLPVEASVFVEAFDSGVDVLPQTFLLTRRT